MATIMIVDDSETVRSQLRDAFEGAGHTVLEAIDGLDGYEKITEAAKLDLVIADYNMPGIDGISMLSRVKEKLGVGIFPIFMMTAGGQKLIPKAKEVGVTAWITKPFNLEKLLMAVTTILATAPSKHTPELDPK